MQAAAIQEVELTLRTLMLIQGAIFGAAWLVLWKFFKKDLPYGVYFSAGNLLVGFGVLLIYERSRVENFATIQAADWMIVAGLSVFQYGLVQLVQASKSRPWRAAAPLLVEILGTAFVEASAGSYCSRAMVFNLVSGYLCASTAVTLLLSKQASLDLDIKAFLVFPFMVGAALFFTREIQVGYACSSPTPLAMASAVHYRPYLWTFICLTVFLNISISGIVVSHLIGRLRQAATTDALTGCLNRAAILSPDVFERVPDQQAGEGHACLMIDVDHFKAINDRYGHQCGDAALVHLTRIIRSNIRSSDQLGRVGGEEFLVIMPTLALDAAKARAERIRAALESQPLAWEGHLIALTASFGVAHFTIWLQLQDAIKRADKNLYWAKNQGRNRVAAVL